MQPSAVPKRGKGGSLQSRQALLHSLVHIENCEWPGGHSSPWHMPDAGQPSPAPPSSFLTPTHACLCPCSTDPLAGAIDLSWDIIARFGQAYDMPR